MVLLRGRSVLGACAAILFPDMISGRSIAGVADQRGGGAEATAVAEGVAQGKLGIDPSGVADASDGTDGNGGDVNGAVAMRSRREEQLR